MRVASLCLKEMETLRKSESTAEQPQPQPHPQNSRSNQGRERDGGFMAFQIVEEKESQIDRDGDLVRPRESREIEGQTERVRRAN